MGGVWTVVLLLWICMDDGFTEDIAFHNATVNSRMSIPCPTMTGEDLLYQLYLDKFCLHSIQLRKNGNWKTRNESQGWVQLIGANQNSTHYLVTVNQTGLYTCKVEVHNPPPYREQSLRTVLYVKEGCYSPLNNQTPHTNQTWQRPTDCFSILGWSLMVACVSLFLYSIVMSGIAVYYMRKLKREKHCQPVYMNTKPREFTKAHGQSPTPASRPGNVW